MSTEPNPLDCEGIYDTILLRGVTSPGVVTLSGHERAAAWDVQAGVGVRGGNTRLKSLPPGSFTATFYLSDRAEFDAWASFRDLIFSSVSGPSPIGLEIYHPDLVVNGFRTVSLATMGGVVHDHKGGQTIAVKFQEYAPPKPVKPIPKVKDPRVTAREAEIARLTAQNERTPWG